VTKKKPPSSTIDPVFAGFGGVREVQRRLKGSELIYKNRDALAAELLQIAGANVTDIVEWKDGATKLKAIEDIPKHVLGAIRRVRVTPTQHGQQVDVELIDKVRVYQMLAKAAGLLDAEHESDKPAVVEVNMIAPKEKE
jgi:predicted nicotinamide N-methyase